MSSSTGVRRTWPEGGISSGAPHPHPPHSLTCRINTSLPAPEDAEIPCFTSFTENSIILHSRTVCYSGFVFKIPTHYAYIMIIHCRVKKMRMRNFTIGAS